MLGVLLILQMILAVMLLMTVIILGSCNLVLSVWIRRLDMYVSTVVNRILIMLNLPMKMLFPPTT